MTTSRKQRSRSLSMATSVASERRRGKRRPRGLCPERAAARRHRERGQRDGRAAACERDPRASRSPGRRYCGASDRHLNAASVVGDRGLSAGHADCSRERGDVVGAGVAAAVDEEGGRAGDAAEVGAVDVLGDAAGARVLAQVSLEALDVEAQLLGVARPGRSARARPGVPAGGRASPRRRPARLPPPRLPRPAGRAGGRRSAGGAARRSGRRRSRGAARGRPVPPVRSRGTRSRRTRATVTGRLDRARGRGRARGRRRR